MQLLAIFLFGTVAIYLAGNIQIGTYDSIEAPVEKYGDEYRLDISDYQTLTLDSSISISWCFDKLVGKRYPVERKPEADATIFVLNTDSLNSSEYARLDSSDTIICVDYKKSVQPLFRIGGNHEKTVEKIL